MGLKTKEGVKDSGKKIHRFIKAITKGDVLGQKRKERGVKDPGKRLYLDRFDKKRSIQRKKNSDNNY